jgi:hypothetical protein
MTYAKGTLSLDVLRTGREVRASGACHEIVRARLLQSSDNSIDLKI